VYKNKPNSVIFVAQVHFREQDRKAFSRLKASARKPFLHAVETTLNQFDVIYGYYPRFEVMEYVEIQKRIFFEALTKQKLFDIGELIYRATRSLFINYAKYLSP
jgi:hypothetical protein